MSTKDSRRSRAIQRYEQHPPRCATCTYYRAEQKAAPPVLVRGIEVAPALRHINPTCVWPVKHRDSSSFAVVPGGICDEWVHKITKETIAHD